MIEKIKWIGVILFTLTIFNAHTQDSGNTLYNNFKWEVGYSLPTTFGGANTILLGSSVLLKKSFNGRNGKSKAYRYGLNYSNRNVKVSNSSTNYKFHNIFIGPQFGIEKRKYLSNKLCYINGCKLDLI